MGAQEKWKAGKQACPPPLPPILFAFRPSFHSLSLFPSRYIAEFVPDCWTRGTLIAPLLRSSASRYYGDCFDLSVFPLREILKRHLRTKTSAFGNDSTSSKDELRHATYFSYDFEHACKLSSCRSGERSNQRTTDRERGRGDVDSFLPLSLHRNSGE